METYIVYSLLASERQREDWTLCRESQEFNTLHEAKAFTEEYLRRHGIAELVIMGVYCTATTDSAPVTISYTDVVEDNS